MRLKLNLLIILIVGALISASCIRNDIPYPRIQANFLTFEVDYQDRGSLIDSASRTITVYLPEEVDIENVMVHDYTVTPGARVVDIDLKAPIDLSYPLYVDLELYQVYTWTISAVQNITRYFTVAGQVGVSTIDVPGRRVVAEVAKTADLSKITVETIKLGPEGSVMQPDLKGEVVDFTKPVEVTVEAYGRSEVWTLYVQNSDLDVATVSVDAWTNVAWVYGRGEAGKDNGIEYRLTGDSEWTRVDRSDLTVQGGDFYACIKHLTALTTYETRAYSGDAYGDVLTFTTGSALQLPNESFDNWWLNGKIWCPWAEGGEPYWDTGNTGAATLGQSNSVPTEDTSSGTGWAAMLQTKFIGIFGLGKLAAGNIFIGSYVRTDGTNGVLSFGRPFAERPTKLRGYLKYNTAPIDYAAAEFDYMKGKPDTCIVWMALIDTPEPFEIRTNPKDRNLFDPNGDYVVAYGKIEYGESVPSYIPFEFDLKYTSTSRVPRYILVTASSSKYGDYFTGGTGAVLYVDDLELMYDY